MIIYEVNLIINTEIYQEYLDWLTPHAKAMCQQQGFKDFTMAEETEKVSEKNRHLTVWYHVETQKDLTHYFDHHANTMREDGIQRFGNQFSATRRILNQVCCV